MFDAELDSIPTAAPRDLKLLPGLSYSAMLGRSFLIFPLILLPLVCLFPLLMMAGDPHMKMMLSTTELVPGKLVAVEPYDSRHCPEQKLQTYAFTVPSGAEYRSETEVCKHSPGWTRKVGDAVPVRYMVSDPANNELADRARDRFHLFPILFMPFFLIVILSALFLPQLRAVRQARKLFKEGQLARATVIFIKKRAMAAANNAMALYPSEVFLSYQTPQGTFEAKALCGNDWLMQQLAPGARVHIAYLPKKPLEAMILEAYFR